MSELVDRAADALFAHLRERNALWTEDREERHSAAVDQVLDLSEVVRVVLNEAREPTAAMKEAAAHDAAMGHFELSPAGARAIYTAMIDEALR